MTVRELIQALRQVEDHDQPVYFDKGEWLVEINILASYTVQEEDVGERYIPKRLKEGDKFVEVDS